METLASILLTVGTRVRAGATIVAITVAWTLIHFLMSFSLAYFLANFVKMATAEALKVLGLHFRVTTG